MMHRLLPILALAPALAAQETRPPATQPTTDAAAPRTITIADVGFATPESVLWDPDADVYLVSNINGKPTDKDDNGFISRLTPDGKVEKLKWIDGADKDVTLNAPKGMTLSIDLLYVADIDVVRVFDRKTGKPRGEIAIPGATFVNDVHIFGMFLEGPVIVSDTGLKPDFTPSGTAALWAIDQETRTATKLEEPKVISKEAIGLPNGVLYFGSGWAWVTWDRGELNLFSAHDRGSKLFVAKLPKAQLDGLVHLGSDEGDFMVSSWEGGCVYRVSNMDRDAKITVEIDGLKAPADLGYDEKRRRLLIPLFNDDKVVLHTLPPPAQRGRRK